MCPSCSQEPVTHKNSFQLLSCFNDETRGLILWRTDRVVSVEQPWCGFETSLQKGIKQNEGKPPGDSSRDRTSSPNVGGHQQPLQRVTFSPSQKGHGLNHQANPWKAWRPGCHMIGPHNPYPFLVGVSFGGVARIPNLRHFERRPP